MKILLFLQSLGVGGPERQFLALADQLRKRDHEVSLVALHTLDPDWKRFPGQNTLQPQVLFAKMPDSLWTAGLQLVRATQAIRHLLRKDGMDVTYAAAGPSAKFIAWLATRKAPGTELIWGLRTSNSGKGRRFSDWKGSLMSALCRRVSSSVPLLISNSEVGRKSRRDRGYRCRRCIVIPNGIDTNQFLPDPASRAKVRTEWHVPQDAKLIGVAARLVPKKDHLSFLRAAAQIAKGNKTLRFVCVGDGPSDYRHELQARARQLGLTDRLVWAGTRTDMPAVYNALDILCSSSCQEGFPNVIAEAMACGVPCVATDVGDSALIVGELGIIVPAGNFQILAAALEEGLRSLEQIQPDLIRNRILANFSLPKMVTATEDLLTAESRREGGRPA